MENDNIINEVRKANNIVDVISSYLPLSKKGKNYFGVCPFHDDSNPSMSVSEEKQIYKCFACGASGNVYNFVMDFEQVDFKEALNILAKRVGIKTNSITVKDNNRYEKYYKMYDIALMLYQNNINSSLGKEAKEYLHKRGIDDDIIKTFKIGLATNDNNSLTNILQKKDYTKRELESYGLGNGTNDLFINRIMFPLFDISAHPVGFSGRIYNMKSDSKYINTKETNIFKKGNLLYNYYNAKEYSRESKSIIIVEGFMDVIRLYTIGIKNVVALMGTAITKEHMNLIKKLSNNVYLSLDGDEAGQKADFNVGEKLEEQGFNIHIVPLKDDLDPDEYILKNGVTSYKSLVTNAISFGDFKIDYLKKGKKLTSIDDQTNYINSILHEIDKEKDSVKQELMLKRISQEFNINIDILRNKLQKEEKSSKIEPLNKAPIKKQKLDKYQKASDMILLLMINDYNNCKIYERKLNFLPYANSRYLANEIIYYYKMHDNLEIADFFTSLNDKKDLKDKLKELLTYNIDDFEENAILDCIKDIKEYNNLEEIKFLKSKMSKEYDPIQKAKIAEKIVKLKMGADNNDK